MFLVFGHSEESGQGKEEKREKRALSYSMIFKSTFQWQTPMQPSGYCQLASVALCLGGPSADVVIATTDAQDLTVESSVTRRRVRHKCTVDARTSESATPCCFFGKKSQASPNHCVSQNGQYCPQT